MTSGMQVYYAARAFKDHLTVSLFGGVDFGDLNDPVSLKHLNWMLCQICTGPVSGGKAQRWIGYVQGVLVAKGHMTLDELNEIISKYRDK